MALIEASLEELPVRADLGQSCLATKISAPGPSILGGSATPEKPATARSARGPDKVQTCYSHEGNNDTRILGEKF